MPDGREIGPEEQEKAYKSVSVAVKKCVIYGCDGDVVCTSKWTRNTSVDWLDAREERRMAACNTCGVLYNEYANDCSLAIARARFE